MEMYNGLNLNYISDYSKKFAGLIESEAYASKDKLSGNDLMKVTKVEQINYFLLKNLFVNWQQDWESLKSPYFDFDHPEVEKGLKDFMNKLSNHISVRKEHFTSLLINAIQNSIILAFSPYDYYFKEIQQIDDPIHVHKLKSVEKYIKINKHLYKAFLNKVYLDSQSEVSKEKALNVLNYIFETIEDTPEDYESFITQMSQVLPLNAEKIYEDSAEENNEEGIEEKKEAVGDLIENVRQKAEVTNSSEASAKLNKILNIRKSLGINQRYMFLKELFGNNSDDFEEALEKLESFESQHLAMNYLEEHFSKKYQWDMESEEVQEFYEVLERRF